MMHTPRPLTPDEVKRRGVKAQDVLDNPSFLQVIQSLQAECFDLFIASAPAETVRREDAYMIGKGLEKIIAKLREYVQQGENEAAMQRMADAQRKRDIR